MKIKPIDPSLRPALEEFLTQTSLQPKFAVIAHQLGYRGSDPDKISVALFTPNENNEICFANEEVYEMFVDFQILKQLSLVEPYKSLIERHPEIIPELIKVSKEILEDGEVNVSSVMSLFEGK